MSKAQLSKGLLKRLLLTLLAATAWAAEPDLIVNNLAGSDTAASGAPSTFGPFSQAAACSTAGASTTINWTAQPCTGIPTDGSALLWMATASGRRFSKITATAVNSITVEDSFNIAAAVDCACGGKRASISSSRTLTDLKQGWSLAIEFTGTAYTHAALVLGPGNFGSGRRIHVRGTGASRPTLTWTSNSTGIQDPGSFYLEDLIMTNTNATKTAAFALDLDVDFVMIRNVQFNGWNGMTGTNGQHVWYRNEFTGNGGLGLNLGNRRSFLLANYMHDLSPGTAAAGTAGGSRATGIYNLAVRNTGSGFAAGLVGNLQATADDNDQHGFAIGATDNGSFYASLISSNNSLRGCDAGATVANLSRGRIFSNNNYFSNVSSNTCPTGTGDTALNPGFTNPAANDWSIGTALSDLGFPPNTVVAGVNSNTVTNTEPGASLRQGSTGGGNFAY